MRSRRTAAHFGRRTTTRRTTCSPRASGSTTSRIPRAIRSRIPRRRATSTGRAGRRSTSTSVGTSRTTNTRPGDSCVDHPDEKAKLAAQAVRMEWDPRTTASATDSGHGAIRSLAQPLYTSLLYALALIGIFVTARRFVGLALAVLAYQTVAAMAFVGATRYRVATDFLIALLAAGAIEWVLATKRTQMKILHVQRIGGIGGSERHLLTLLPALAERGVDVASSDSTTCRAHRTVLRNAVVQFALDPPRRATWIQGWRSASERETRNADLVHTHLVHADLYGSAREHNRLVSTKHNDDPFRAGAFRFVERALTRRASKVIAITEALARFQVEPLGLPADKLEVIHYGLDELAGGMGRPIQRTMCRRMRACCSLSATRAPERPGHRSAGACRRSAPAIRKPSSWYSARAAQRSELEQLATSTAGGRCTFSAACPTSPRGFRRADLFVHPARREGFGLLAGGDAFREPWSRRTSARSRRSSPAPSGAARSSGDATSPGSSLLRALAAGR